MTHLTIVLPELLPVPPVQGGAVEHWVHEVTKRYPQDGTKITIVSRPAGVEGEPGIAYLGVPWTRTESMFSRLKHGARRGSLLRAAAKVQNVIGYGRRAARLVGGSDVVCVENDPNLVFFLRKARDQKIILHMHNDHLISRTMRRLYSRVLGKTHLVLCVSNYIRSRAAEMYPEHAAKFRLLMNGTDTDFFHPADGQRSPELQHLLEGRNAGRFIAFVGRVVEDKGVHVLLEAFAQIAPRFPDLTLLVVGSSFFGGAATTDYQRRMAKQAEPLRDRILFTGFLGQDLVRQIYCASELVIVPSIWNDPCPLVVLEAMSCGTAVIASDVGGIPEMIVNADVGTLVPPGSADRLAAAIAENLDDAAGLKQRGSAARDYVLAHHSWGRVVKELAGHVEALA